MNKPSDVAWWTFVGGFVGSRFAGAGILEAAVCGLAAGVCGAAGAVLFHVAKGRESRLARRIRESR